MPGSAPLRVSTVVYLHGAGSRGSVARDLLPPATVGRTASGTAPRVHLLEDRRGDIGVLIGRLDRLMATVPVPVALVGVSLGALALARWAAGWSGRPAGSLVLALPAWTGDPGPVARATQASARLVASSGRADALARMRDPASGVPAGLVDLVARGWAAYPEAGLVAALERAAGQSGPTTDELERIAWPTLVIGIRDDALHPLSVAREWRQRIPRATLATAALADLGVAGGSGLDRALRRGLVRLSRLPR